MIPTKIENTFQILICRSLKNPTQPINKALIADGNSAAILENRGGGRPSEEYEIQEIK